MVIRFTCGWLSDRAACLVPILCHNLTPAPLPLRDMPMYHQLYYYNRVLEYSDWKEFTEVYCLIATILFETNSPSLRRYFDYFTAILPEDKYLYFIGSVSPNEWHCFVNSIQHLGSIQVLYIDTSLINITQFKQLLNNLSDCSLTYLALSFSKCDYPFIQEFTSLLDTADRPVQFKISLELIKCDLPKLLTPKFIDISRYFHRYFSIFSSIIIDIFIDNHRYFSIISSIFLDIFIDILSIFFWFNKHNIPLALVPFVILNI